MTQSSRRRLLAGVAAALPAAWTRPVVESIVLPAHAQTSGCGADPGCYAVPGRDVSFDWPGGAGPVVVDFLDGRECGGEPTGASASLVVGTSAEEAALALSCLPFPAAELTTDPSPVGCRFFICDEPAEL